MGNAPHFSRHDFLEHEADIGLRGTGDCWNCAFAAAAAGLLEIMAEPSAVRPDREMHVRVSAGDIGALFVSWLNELLYLKDAEEMIFSSFDISIEGRADGGYELNATVRGEKMDSKRHGFKTEVKAATFSGLKFGDEEGRHYAQCLLDL